MQNTSWRTKKYRQAISPNVVFGVSKFTRWLTRFTMDGYHLKFVLPNIPKGTCRPKSVLALSDAKPHNESTRLYSSYCNTTYRIVTPPDIPESTWTSYDILTYMEWGITLGMYRRQVNDIYYVLQRRKTSLV